MHLTVVLAVGLDLSLSTRQSTDWKSAGYVVISTASIREAIVHFIDGDFDLVLLGKDVYKRQESAVDAIGAACRQAGVMFTVIRPTAYFSDLTNRAFDSVLKRGRYTVVGDGSHRINPVDGDDVAVFIADCIGNPEMAGREHQIGGPDIFTFREIGLLAAEVIGLPAPLKIRSIPSWSLRFIAAMAAMVGLVSSKSRRSAAILRWMI